MKELPKSLKILKNFFGGVELGELISFNEFCGGHIHFSTLPQIDNNFITYTIFNKIREKTFERIKKELPHIYNEWVKRYYRNYSRQYKFDKIPRSRECEFNFTALNRGIEWRAFHFFGVKKWKELELLLTIAITTIEDVYEEYIKNDQKEELTFYIPEESLKVQKILNSNVMGI